MEKFMVLITNPETREEFGFSENQPYPVYEVDVNHNNRKNWFLITNREYGFVWVEMNDCKPYFG